MSLSMESQEHGFIFDGDNTAGQAGTSRASITMNDDDYDYALELRPDEEYRRVASSAALVVDFKELESLRRNKLSSCSIGERFTGLGEADSDDENFVDDLQGNHEIGIQSGALRSVWNGVLRSLGRSEKLNHDGPQEERSSSSASHGNDIETGLATSSGFASSPSVHRRANRSPSDVSPAQQDQSSSFHMAPLSASPSTPSSSPSKVLLA